MQMRDIAETPACRTTRWRLRARIKLGSPDRSGCYTYIIIEYRQRETQQNETGSARRIFEKVSQKYPHQKTNVQLHIPGTKPDPPIQKQNNCNNKKRKCYKKHVRCHCFAFKQHQVLWQKVQIKKR